MEDSEMNETGKSIIKTLKLGNLCMALDPEIGSRADTAMKQDHLLDLLELFVDASEELSEKEKK